MGRNPFLITSRMGCIHRILYNELWNIPFVKCSFSILLDHVNYINQPGRVGVSRVEQLLEITIHNVSLTVTQSTWSQNIWDLESYE